MHMSDFPPAQTRNWTFPALQKFLVTFAINTLSYQAAGKYWPIFCYYMLDIKLGF